MMRVPARFRTRSMARAALLMGLVTAPACGNTTPADPVKPVYSKETGVLTELRFDSNKDGKPDTRTFMDRGRPVRSEIDADQNGIVERWEYYGADGKLQRVGSASAGDGKEDTWTFPAPDGGIARIELATRRDGKVNRIEMWERGMVTSVQEDTEGDGRPDRWETYRDGELSMVALDTTHRNGRPDRRLIYRAGGELERIEADPDGDGIFTPVGPRTGR